MTALKLSPLVAKPSRLADYSTFIQRKSQIDLQDGFTPVWMPEFLFDFQAYIVDWAVRKGRAAIFADCGLGKTPMQLVWAENIARKTGKSVLIVTPLAVAAQTEREAVKFGIDAKVSREGAVHRITITNYERLHYFDQKDFVGAVADECFPPDTAVDTPSGCRYIKDVQRGDSILNANGVDHVQETYKRRIDRAVRVTAGTARFTCSANHLFFTVHGWRRAEDLRSGDFLVETGTAVRMVRRCFPTEESVAGSSAFLRSILLSEMADESSDPQGKSSHGRDIQESSLRSCGVAGQSQHRAKRRAATEECSLQSLGGRSGEAEDVAAIAGHRSSSAYSWRQREASDSASAIAVGYPRRRMATGAFCLPGCGMGSFLSESVQAGPSEYRTKNRHRSRWSQASLGQGTNQGPEKGWQAGLARVDSVEVLELGHPDLDCYREKDGNIYFYDLEAARHPSFSVSGLLVHNSSAIKAFDGKRRKNVVRFFSKLQYRLLCTATPSPNDFIELGTQSECLGVMTQSDMLGFFFRETENMRHCIFKNDDFWNKVKWWFKPHSEKSFWRWVTSWAKACRSPADIGFDDSKFVLPPLHYVKHVLDVPYIPKGELFPRPAIYLHEQREERHRTLHERCEKAAEVLKHDRPSIAWCHYNEESELLSKLIPDSVEVAGKHSDDHKEAALNDFAIGNIKTLVSKPKIACWGMNFQHCADMATFPSFSFEGLYQGIRRCWRFGQKQPVTVNIVSALGESEVIDGLTRKQEQADRMFAQLVAYINDQLHMCSSDGHTTATRFPSWI